MLIAQSSYLRDTKVWGLAFMERAEHGLVRF